MRRSRVDRAKAVRVLAVAIAAMAGVGLPAVLPPTTAAAATAKPFPVFAPGFTQALFASGATTDLYGGVAFAPNGDVWTDDCVFSAGGLRRFSQTSTHQQDGASLANETDVASNVGCGLANNPDGHLYSNTTNGVTQLDALSGAYLKTIGPPGNVLGITTDPQTNNLVYVAADCRFTSTCTIVSLNPTTGSSTNLAVLSSSQASFVDGIAFDPTGKYLFLSTRAPSFALTVVGRAGNVVQHAPMTSEPDGISFHGTSPKFVVTNNTDGTITRFDFPSDDYTKAPTASVFASGGHRGDLSSVGADGCIYLTQDGTTFPDGTTSANNSLVKVCPGFAPPPGVSTAGLLAFGDSIAAGYGLGEADGLKDDNRDAYPALVAGKLGLGYHNFASAGACASASDAIDPYSLQNPSCGLLGQIPVDQQIANAPASPVPKLITLTVGGNDINFQQCFEAVVFGTFNDPKQDPCEPNANLPNNISAFAQSLSSDLSALNGPGGKYPGVPVVITGYFNPLPSGTQPLCDLDAAIGTWLYLKQLPGQSTGDQIKSILGIFLRQDEFTAGLNQVQAAIFGRANYILGHLGAAIQAVAASSPNVTYASLNFSGHDMCQGSQSWVFGPDVSVTLKAKIGQSYSLSYHYAPFVCPALGTPFATLEQGFGPLSVTLSLPGNNSVSASLSGGTNCLPHPTVTGQQQIANQVFTKVP